MAASYAEFKRISVQVGGGLKQKKKTLDSIKSKLGFPGEKEFKMFCRLGVLIFLE